MPSVKLSFRKLTHFIVILFLSIYPFILLTTRHKAVPRTEPSNSENSCQTNEYHNCVYQQLPIVLGMLETALYLHDHKNASFVRFGNGDIDLMSNISTNYQEVSDGLRLSMLQTLTAELPDYFVGIPNVFGGFPQINVATQRWWKDNDQYRTFLLAHINMNRIYLDSFISDINVATWGTFCGQTHLVYELLRDVWRNRELVIVKGDNKQVYQYDIYDTSRSQHIILAPRYQAWNAYDALKQQILAEDPRKLFILTCGPACKVLVRELRILGRQALDLGHLAKDYDYYMTQKNPLDFWND